MKPIHFAAVMLVIAMPATAGDVYRCKDTNGRVLVQDKPCPGAGEKIDVKPNSTGPVRSSDAEAQLRAINDRLNARIKAEDDEREAKRADYEKRLARCQDFVDEADRQAAWRYSRSLAVRESAATAIQIQRRKYFENRCDRIMDYFR